MKRNKKIKILIIEDEINTIRAAILKLRKRNNTVVDHVVFMEEAEDLLKSQLYNLIIVDARIPSIKQDKLVEEGGLELMHKLTSSESGTININTKYIILSSQAHSLRSESEVLHENCKGLFPKLLYSVYMNFISDFLDKENIDNE